MALAIVVFATLVLAFVLLSRGLGRLYVTAPIVFVGAGAAASTVAPGLSEDALSAFSLLAEVTLALILFHDAAQVRPREIRADPGPALRLLLLGLPLTIGLGYLAARVIWPDIPLMVALLLAAALAPTDAGLGAATVLNPVVPVRVRRLLNVESGLNDGLATPVVLFAIAALAGAEGLAPAETVGAAAADLTVGALVGLLVGACGGTLLRWSARRGLSDLHSHALGVLTLPILAYFVASLGGGNAFVASFVAGTAYAGVAGLASHETSSLALTEALSEPLGFAVWLAFGYAAMPLVLGHLDWRTVLYAVLSLTVLRMGPVALALAGSGFRPVTVGFVAWFGPRGLASVVFALLAVEELRVDASLQQALATISLTVLLSVVAHGLSAEPFAARYGAWVRGRVAREETAPAAEPHPRRTLMHRRHLTAKAPTPSP
jgi:sodium/hydrogen antiporter